jgi:hypothetical protein
MKTSRIIASAVVTVLALATTATAFASFYPADRPTYTCTTPTNCKGADHVVFDSFTNNPELGDERAFLAGSINGANVQDRMQVKDGDQIVVRAYVHNNADASLMNGEANTVAKNVHFTVALPTSAKMDTNIVGFITADNASPSTVNDTMSVYGASPFTLEYVKGSASFSHKADGINQITTKLGDAIVGDGVSLGNINGCFAYSGYVYLTVKVHMPTTTKEVPAYSCDLLHVVADNQTRKVTIDTFNTTVKNGATFKQAVIDWGETGQQALTTNSVMGQTHQYAADGTYTITANAQFNLPDGSVAIATSEQCKQTVTFSTTTTPPVTPPKLPDTGAGDVIAIVAGAIAAGTIGARLFLSRKLARR